MSEQDKRAETLAALRAGMDSLAKATHSVLKDMPAEAWNKIVQTGTTWMAQSMMTSSDGSFCVMVTGMRNPDDGYVSSIHIRDEEGDDVTLGRAAAAGALLDLVMREGAEPGSSLVFTFPDGDFVAWAKDEDGELRVMQGQPGESDAEAPH